MIKSGKNEAYTGSHLTTQLGMRDLIAHREQIIARGIKPHGIVPYRAVREIVR